MLFRSFSLRDGEIDICQYGFPVGLMYVYIVVFYQHNENYESMFVPAWVVAHLQFLSEVFYAQSLACEQYDEMVDHV